MQNIINVWGESVPREIFTDSELDYLELFTGTQLPDVTWVWSEMDRVWDSFGLNNRLPFFAQNVAQFYSHPVWIMNAFYTGADPISVKHRNSIAQYISKCEMRRIADYGGGGGELARRISILCPGLEIEIIEPFPSALGKYRVSHLENVSFSDKLNGKYDLVIAQDVLEHVENPIGTAEEIYRALEAGGVAIFANCFFPVIKCHLPKTFHLREIFRFVIGLGGFNYKGEVKGAEHAKIYMKQNDKSGFPVSVFIAEKLSINLGWILNMLASLKKKLRNNKLY